MTIPLKRVGIEFRANTTIPGNQINQSVAALTSGGFAIAWAAETGDGSGYGVFAQRFDFNGARIGGQFQVNTVTLNYQGEPSVAGLPSGGFVVTWTDGSVAGSSDVRGRIFDSAGIALGPDFLVNTATAYYQDYSNVFALPNGGFVASWVDVGDTSNLDSAYNVRAQVFDSSGAKIGSEFPVHSSLAGVQARPTGIAFGTGNFIILWSDINNGQYDVKGQIFDSLGNRIGDVLQIPASAAGEESSVDVAALPDGGFVVSWQAAEPGSSFYYARAQKFDSSGSKVGPEVSASDAHNKIGTVNVTGLESGGFLVSWEDRQGTAPATRAQMFDSEGNRIGSQFQLHMADKTGGFSDLATLSSGRVVATWNYGSFDVNGQVFRAPVIGTPLSDTLEGGGDDDAIAGLASDDILSGGGGNDVLDGGLGADRMTGGTGNDVYAVDDSGDEVVEMAGQGLDEIETGLADYALPDHFENLTGTSVAGGGQILRGNAAANVLTGGAGDDVIHLGSAGSDTIQGGAGDDLLVIDWSDAATVFSMGNGPDQNFVGQQLLGFRGYYQDGAGRSANFFGIERFDISAGSAGDYLLGAGGADRIDGGGGDDRLDGGAGADALLGGDGIDTVDYSNTVSFVDVIVNLGEGTIPNPGGDPVGPSQGLDRHGGLDSLTGIENVRTGYGDDIVQGDSGANRIETDYGSDTLIGGGGDDVLIGGDGTDLMRGGIGDDVYFVDHSGDVVDENVAEGADEVRTALATYVLAAHVEALTATSDSAHDFRGNSGGNVVTGGGGDDVLRLQDGGNDTAIGGAGNDNIFFIASLTAADVVNGGAGVDTLVLQGPYGALALSPNVTQIENVSILGGSNTAFGEPGTNRYDYMLTTSDANFAAGVQARINGAALLAGEDFTFDGSAETNASFVVYGGKGKDTLTGGLGNDIFFYAEERFASGDTVNGGAGYDGMFLRGNYTIDFNAPGYTGLFTNIENLTLTSAADERYARGGGTEFDYNLTLSDAIVGAGQELTVSGALLLASETMVLDAGQETNGTLRLFGGAAGDTLKGGALADLIHGSLGADILAGNGGADVFRYQSTAESTSASMDHILDFAPGVDKVDLSRIDANTLVAGDQAFTWTGANAFGGTAGELIRQHLGGTDWLVLGDTDGNGAADFAVMITAPPTVPIWVNDFIL